jgi:hypothetical protein
MQAMNAKQVKRCPTRSNTPQQLQLFQMDHSQVCVVTYTVHKVNQILNVGILLTATQ